MSRSFPLRRKVLFAFALPAVALGSFCAFTVADASVARDNATDVVDSAIEAQTLQAAALAVGEERLVYAILDLQLDTDVVVDMRPIVAETDGAIAEVASYGDGVLIERVLTSLATARSTPVGRYENFNRAAELLLERADQVAVLSSDGAAQRSWDAAADVHRFIEAEDVAWVSFAERTSEDQRSSASVIELFAQSRLLRDQLSAVAGRDPGGPVQIAVGGTAVMEDLRTRAVEDLLNDGQMIVTDESAILSHRDARIRWVAAAADQSARAQAELESVVSGATSRRNSAALFGLFGVLVLGALALLLVEAVTAPIAAAAHEAHKLVTERIPRMTSSFGKLKQTRPRPIAVETDDEVAELVQAINTIQERFFEVAEQESTNRRLMSGRMISIANRNAALLHELVRHVSSWRNADATPEVRKRLFGIDHIATRMQRNIEAGLVLGGGRSDRRWTKPISAVNTARLALGEIVDYSRVDVSAMEDVRLHGLVAPDVAHVLAELIENGLAAAVDRPESRNRVTVEGEWVSAGWAFLVHDSGPGMDRPERERVNRALHTPELVPSESVANLGFLLIARTAARFGLDVRLIERPAGGMTARVILPVDLIDPETVPADRKKIDAGRGATPDFTSVAAFSPQDPAQVDAVDAYFTTPEPEAGSRLRRRRKTDSNPVAADPESAPTATSATPEVPAEGEPVAGKDDDALSEPDEDSALQSS